MDAFHSSQTKQEETQHVALSCPRYIRREPQVPTPTVEVQVLKTRVDLSNDMTQRGQRISTSRTSRT